MTVAEQVLTQALLLAGALDENESRMLEILCEAVTASLRARLREGLTPENCLADFIAAASLLALAALGDTREEDAVAEFKAGDLSFRKDGSCRDAASRCLQRQGEMLILPYLKDRFCFQGV